MLEEMLKFLRDHQPMPDHPTPQQWTLFKKATLYFYENPTEECIPHFLNSFGDWTNFEICESVQATLARYSHEEVVPHLLRALKSEHFSVRLWCADTARFFPDNRLLHQLERLLNEESLELRLCASAALEVNGSRKARLIAAKRLKIEEDDDVIDILQSF